MPFLCAVLLAACNGTTPHEGTPFQDPLAGAWVDGLDTGVIKVYVTELDLSDGAFGWSFDGALQQRGIYDTVGGVLSLTVQSNYGSPQRVLGAYSRPYSVVGDTLTWGGSLFTRK